MRLCQSFMCLLSVAIILISCYGRNHNPRAASPNPPPTSKLIVAIGFLDASIGTINTAIYDKNIQGPVVVIPATSPIAWNPNTDSLALLTETGIALVHKGSWESLSPITSPPGFSLSQVSTTNVDLSPNGNLLAIWRGGGVQVWDIHSASRIRFISNSEVAKLTGTKRLYTGGFGDGMCWDPTSSTLALAVPSEHDFEEASGGHFPHTWLLDYATPRARWISKGHPVGWIDKETVATLDWSWKIGEGLGIVRVVDRAGRLVFSVQDVESAGAGAGHVVVIRRDEDRKYLLQVIDVRTQATIWSNPISEYKPSWTNSGKILVIETTTAGRAGGRSEN